MWDPAVYRRYGAERARPFFDLVARVGAGSPRAVVDLGCGPGELTLSLAERWPGARLTGIDSSPDMIAKAVAHGGPAEFRAGDVRDWRPGRDVDVVVTNATLQWVPEHRDLLVRWVRELAPGSWLAMQVPGNFGAPSHVLLRAVGERYGVGGLLREAPVDDPAGYAALLTAAGATVDAWETTYLHLLPAGEEGGAAGKAGAAGTAGTAGKGGAAAGSDAAGCAHSTAALVALAAHTPTGRADAAAVLAFAYSLTAIRGGHPSHNPAGSHLAGADLSGWSIDSGERRLDAQQAQIERLQRALASKG